MDGFCWAVSGIVLLSFLLVAEQSTTNKRVGTDMKMKVYMDDKDCGVLGKDDNKIITLKKVGKKDRRYDSYTAITLTTLYVSLTLFSSVSLFYFFLYVLNMH